MAMGSMFKSGHYVWALFLGHLVLEKLLKAVYVKKEIKDFRQWLVKKIKK
jgi:HEPN domain-containing protein